MTFQEYMTRINTMLFEYGGYTSFVLYVILAFVLFKYNPYHLFTRFQPVAIAITLVFGLLIATTSDFVFRRAEWFGSASTQPSVHSWLLKSSSSLGVILAIVAIIFGGFWIFANFGRFLSYLVYVSYAFSIIGGLGLIYMLLGPKLSNIRTPAAIELIKNIIFYLPCLLIDLFDNIAGTKKSIWMLLGFEILALIAYFGIPLLLKSKYVKMGTVLASEPQYLNRISHVDTKAYRDVVERSKETLHYAFTADVWINPQPTSTSAAYTRDTNIISFGDRVRIMYNGKSDPKKLILKAKDGKDEETVITVPILLQKWNTLVVNYDHGTLDLFVNGELVSSTQNVPYLSVAGLEGGAENGIHGGIKNIRYFDKPLTANQMELLSVV